MSAGLRRARGAALGRAELGCAGLGPRDRSRPLRPAPGWAPPQATPPGLPRAFPGPADGSYGDLAGAVLSLPPPAALGARPGSRGAVSGSAGPAPTRSPCVPGPPLARGRSPRCLRVAPAPHLPPSPSFHSAPAAAAKMPDRDGYSNSGGDEAGADADDICRDFLRNVCKRGKRCRFRHPDISEVTNLGVRKNEFIFCHDFQNKECVRLNCRFIHGTKEDEDCYKKTGELPPRLRQKVAAGLGLSPADLPNSKEEVPICRDFLKGDCQRGAKCKFQHLQRDYEYEARGMATREPGMVAAVRRYDPYDAIYDSDRYDDHEPLLKRRRVDGLSFETYEYSFANPRTVEYRLLEEENIMLRKRVEDLKKQVNNLMATNEVLLEQNAQFRNQAKVMTLSSTATATEQTLAPTVGTVTNYNHSIAQTHTTLSSQALQPRPVSQQDLVAPAGAQAAPPANAAPPMNPEITPLSAALAQTIAQGMAPPVSMAPVAVSVAPVAVSMAQPLGGITMSHATTPMVTYPIASQSMRITAMPH